MSKSTKRPEDSARASIQETRVREAVRRARTEAGWSADRLAREVNIAPSLLSMYETGQRPIPADFLLKLSSALGVSVGQVLDEQVEHAFHRTMRFLENSEQLGLEDVFSRRDQALRVLVPYMERMTSGLLAITGSSLRGLWQDRAHPFARAMKDMISEERADVQVIMTHLLSGSARESVEARQSGQIRTEIAEGIRWLVRDIRVPRENIKLLRATPAVFTAFLEWGGDQGIGLINPYPQMREAVSSTTFLVRRAAPAGADGIYQSFKQSNFQMPWDQANNDVVAPLDIELKQILNEIKDEAILSIVKRIVEELDKK